MPKTKGTILHSDEDIHGHTTKTKPTTIETYDIYKQQMDNIECLYTDQRVSVDCDIISSAKV